MCVPNEFNHLAESWKKLREKGFLQGRLTKKKIPSRFEILKLKKGNKDNIIFKLVISLTYFLAKETILNIAEIYTPLFVILYPLGTFICKPFTQMWQKYFYILMLS